MEFRIPDLKAPRFRKSRFSLLNNGYRRKIYFDFLKKYPKYKGMPPTTIRKVLVAFSEEMIKNAIDNRDGVELPANLGYCFIGVCPNPKKYNIDKQKSKDLRVVVRHRNFESDNYLCKIFYSNFTPKSKFQHRDLWNFIPGRNFKKAVSLAFPKNWKRYIQIENYRYISEVFRKIIISKKMRRIESIIPEHYNEFEL